MASATDVAGGLESLPSLRAARRWLVMGGSGAGKSTFSRELAEVLDLPTIHLDREYWRAGWREPSDEAWREKVARLSARDAWIMDGNFSGTLELRLPRAQNLVLLDPPTWRCFVGIWSRAIRFRGQTRPDMAEGCLEKIPDREFMWWVLSYKFRSRPNVLRKHAAAPHVGLHHLTSRRAARDFLERLRETS